MKWLQQFDLILLDFDGLLVNTEELHFEAYRLLCAENGCNLDWDFNRFCAIAHASATGLRETIYAQFPQLQASQPNWDHLYARKKQLYLDLLVPEKLALLPGVDKLLKELSLQGIKRCVATNSAKEQIERIRHALPLLSSIPVWITREQYQQPKPAPDAYLKAIELLADAGDRVVGFEDSMRGIHALQGASAVPVLICSKHHPQLKDESLKGVIHFTSFEEIPAGHSFTPQSKGK